MQKLLLATAISLCAILIACNSEKKPDETATKEATAPAEKINYAYTPTYSGSFEMGDPKQAEAVLKLWKDWDNGDLAPSKDVFADSVWMYFRDGSTMIGPKDSIVAGAQQFRNMYSAVTSRVAAFFPTRSTDKDENWVCVWGTEISTDKKGKVDSVHLQEIWRFNKEGKVNYVAQFGRVAK